MLMTPLTTSQLFRFPCRSRGWGLLQVLLLVFVLALLSAIGYLQWRDRATLHDVQQEQHVLAQADRALIAFASVMHRFPCMDTNRDGIEDCTAAATAQKGWLPSVTLSLAGVDHGIHAGQLRYLVQRGAGGTNLTVSTDAWKPLAYDEGTPSFLVQRSDDYESGIVTLADLCQRLENVRVAPISSALAQVKANPSRVVAYALAHPGSSDADGDGDLFDGENALINTAAMENPARAPQLAQYDDVVLERSASSLLQNFQCAPLINSINTLAIGHDVVEQVADMKADNIDSAKRSVAFSALGAGMTSLEITLAMIEAGSDGSNMAADIALCAATLGLAVNACAAAPVHGLAAGWSSAVLGANAGAVAANIVAAGIAGRALTLADTDATPEQVCPAPDKALQQQAVLQTQEMVRQAIADRSAVQLKVDAKQNEFHDSNIARTNAVATLWNAMRANAFSSGIDGQISDFFRTVDIWMTESAEAELAQARFEQAEQARNRLADEVVKYNQMEGQQASVVALLRDEIAVLDAQIAANPPNRNALEDQRAGKAADLMMAQDLALMQAARDKALESLAQAQDDLVAAAAARDTAAQSFILAQQNYDTAYAALRQAAVRYTRFNSTGNSLAYGCTTGCQPDDIYVDFDQAWSEILGSSVATAPNAESVYLLSQRLRKELDAAIDELEETDKRIDEARSYQDQAETRLNNPVPCNVTGSAVTPMTPEQSEAILIEVDRKGGMR